MRDTISTGDANVASGQTLSVDASALGADAANTLTFTGVTKAQFTAGDFTFV